MRNANRAVCLLVASVLLLPAGRALADDWPQWRGPNRDGLSKETGLLKAWPKDGPKLLWQVKDLGSGYATPSVVGGRIYLMTNKGLEDEFVKALDAKDGSAVWSTRVGKVGNPKQRPNYAAARSTPTVDGAALYALGSDGDLACLERATGKVRWKKNLRTDFGGKPGTWAYSESPLVDGDVVVCTPGGTEATVVALTKKDGGVVWKSAVPGGDTAGYASLVVADTGGVKQYVAFTANGLIGVDAKTGKFLWRYAKTKGAMGMSILTPVVGGGLAYSGAGGPGGGGGGSVKLSAAQGAVKAEEVYFDTKLPTAIGGAVRVGDYLYGSGGQTLVCADFKTGKIKWSERSTAPGAVCYADGRLYLHGENGAVALVETTPEAYRERGRFTPPNPPKRANPWEKAWAYPVIADGRLYVRDTDCLWCYDIKGPGAKK
jgi:outer membrane protein assembly factor BamB